MSIPVFLSYPKPYNEKQKQFITRVSEYLKERNILPRTLGVTDYDMSAPLTAIRRLMLESNGVITIAFRRSYIEKGTERPGKKDNEKDLSGQWLTSPWAHIEPAMAFQIGLPVLIFREKGVIADGVLENGVTGMYMPEFDLEKDLDVYFKSSEWLQLIQRWEALVLKVVENKGRPPVLF